MNVATAADVRQPGFDALESTGERSMKAPPGVDCCGPMAHGNDVMIWVSVDCHVFRLRARPVGCQSSCMPSNPAVDLCPILVERLAIIERRGGHDDAGVEAVKVGIVNAELETLIRQ